MQSSFNIVEYKDILCDAILVYECHFILGRPWKFDHHEIHGGREKPMKYSSNEQGHIVFYNSNIVINLEYYTQ